MTNSRPNNSGSERLNRIEAIIESTTLIAQSNALAVEALRHRQEATDIQLRTSIADLVSMLAQNAEEREQQAVESRQRQLEADEHFQVWLEEARADRRRIDDALAQNRQEHEEFRQTIQALVSRQQSSDSKDQ